MPFRVSFLVESAQNLQGDSTASGLTGQKLSRLGMLRRLVRRPEVEVLELLVEPAVLTSQDSVQALAQSLLAPDLMGQGKLEILPSHYLPEIWGDGRERLIFCHEVVTLARDRRLRDRWAKAASPIFWGTSFQPGTNQQLAMWACAGLEKVEYDRVLCISQCVQKGMQNAFESILGDTPASLCLQPHVVDLKFLSPADNFEKADLRQRFGLPLHGVIALHLSRLTPSSKADLAPLVERFCRDCKEGEHLVIAGESNATGYVQTLQALVPPEKSAQVHIFGAVAPKDRRDFIAACDVFAFPADFLMEGQGLVVSEALACGLPVVATHLTGATEPLIDSKNGYKIPTWIIPAFGRSEAMAEISTFAVDGILQAQCVWFDWTLFMDRLWDLMRDSSLRKQLSENASASLTGFDEKILMDQFCRMAEESISLARQDAEARNARREALVDKGPRVKMWEVFNFSGKTTAGPQTLIKLTEEGMKGLQTGQGILIYSDLLPFSNKEIQHKVLHQLSLGAKTFGELSNLAPATELGLQELHLQIALLLKQGWLEIGV